MSTSPGFRRHAANLSLPAAAVCLLLQTGPLERLTIQSRIGPGPPTTRGPALERNGPALGARPAPSGPIIAAVSRRLPRSGRSDIRLDGWPSGGNPVANRPAVQAKSLICRISSVVEQRFCKPLVGGSNPPSGTSKNNCLATYFSAARQRKFARGMQQGNAKLALALAGPAALLGSPHPAASSTDSPRPRLTTNYQRDRRHEQGQDSTLILQPTG
jgi:hypothetical protein